MAVRLLRLRSDVQGDASPAQHMLNAALHTWSSAGTRTCTVLPLSMPVTQRL